MSNTEEVRLEAVLLPGNLEAAWAAKDIKRRVQTSCGPGSRDTKGKRRPP